MPNRDKKKLLVIDDDALVRRTIEKVLKHGGYDVVVAKNSQDAIAAIKAHDFDLVVSDIRMPEKNGVETVREIKKIVNENQSKQNDIPIIFITGFAESIDELKAEILGEVILKPFDLDFLLTTIREYL